MHKKIISISSKTTNQQKVLNLIFLLLNSEETQNPAEELTALGFYGHAHHDLHAFLNSTPLKDTLAPLYFRVNDNYRITTEYDLVTSIIYELSLNKSHLAHNSKMIFLAHEITEGNRKGIELYICDNGAGIANILWAIEAGNTSSGQSWRGKGLPYIKKCALSDNKGYLEIGTNKESYTFNRGITPANYHVAIPLGTYVRVVRFYE